MSILAITSLLNPDPSSAGVERTGESSALPPQASSPSLEPRHRPEDRGQGDGRCSPWRQNTSTSIAGSLPFVPRSSTLPSHQHGPAVAVPETSFRRDPGRIPKSRPKGEVNFLPFEDVSHETRHRILRFHVHALGNIRDSCQHIPYNSGKKDFFEKTGRESLEVFCYSFKLDENGVEYTVRWDYNVGLVRMTDFFKALNHPKTAPAKMLNQNEGLKAITPSITGGSIKAQGYWMPYKCARAICANFCHPIADALIPLFGPGFPSACIPPEHPNYESWVINPAVIAESRAETQRYKLLYMPLAAGSAAGGGGSRGSSAASSPRRIPARREARITKGAFYGDGSAGITGADDHSGQGRFAPGPVLAGIKDRHRSMGFDAGDRPGQEHTREHELPDRRLGRDFGVENRSGPYGVCIDGGYYERPVSRYGRPGGRWCATAPTTPTYTDGYRFSGFNSRHTHNADDLNFKMKLDSGATFDSHTRSQPLTPGSTKPNPALSAFPRGFPPKCSPGTFHWAVGEKLDAGRDRFEGHPLPEAAGTMLKPSHSASRPSFITTPCVESRGGAGPLDHGSTPGEPPSGSVGRITTGFTNPASKTRHGAEEEDIRATAAQAVAMYQAQHGDQGGQKQRCHRDPYTQCQQLLAPSSGGHSVIRRLSHGLVPLVKNRRLEDSVDDSAALLLLQLRVQDRTEKGDTQNATPAGHGDDVMPEPETRGGEEGENEGGEDERKRLRDGNGVDAKDKVSAEVELGGFPKKRKDGDLLPAPRRSKRRRGSFAST